MTKQHTPDRIWAWTFNPGNQNAHMKGGWDDEEDKKEASYLLSTPEREAAPDLLEALEAAVEQLKGCGADGYASGADAAIRKAKGETE